MEAGIKSHRIKKNKTNGSLCLCCSLPECASSATSQKYTCVVHLFL